MQVKSHYLAKKKKLLHKTNIPPLCHISVILYEFVSLEEVMRTQLKFSTHFRKLLNTTSGYDPTTKVGCYFAHLDFQSVTKWVSRFLGQPVNHSGYQWFFMSKFLSVHQLSSLPVTNVVGSSDNQLVSQSVSHCSCSLSLSQPISSSITSSINS